VRFRIGSWINVALGAPRKTFFSKLLDEIDRVTTVASVINFSMKQMAKIDAAYDKAFPG
jgi:hypothetical protein